MLEQLLSGFMGIADTMMVTRVGDTAISAVSCVDSLNTLMLLLFSALATGGTIVCSQYLGCEDRENAQKAARQVYLVSVGLSLVLMCFCLLLRRVLLQLIFGGVEEAIMSQALSYFLVTAFSYPFLAIQQTSAAQFRAAGNSRLPMTVTAIANCLNVGGNAVLIFVLHWGVTGAAISTLVARMVSAVTLLCCQRNPDNVICFRDYGSIRPDRRIIRMVLRIGIPTGVENGLFQLGKLLVQSTVSSLGTTALAAQAMVCMLDSFQSMPCQAIGLGMLTVVGQCMGAGRVDEAKRYTKKLCTLSECIICVTSGLVLAVTKPVIFLAGMSQEAGELTFRMVLYISIAKVLLWMLSFTLPNSLKAAGDVAFPAAVSALSMWVFRVALSAFLCRVMGVGLVGVWIAWFADWICRLICFVARYRSGKWTGKKVIQTT
jgi:putative MATE family efflux protein